MKQDYEKLVDEFIRNHNADFADVFKDLGEKNLRALLLDQAQKIMPAKEKQILLAQEIPLKFLTTYEITQEHKQAALKTFQEQLTPFREETDQKLSAFESDANKLPENRLKEMEAMFDMHMYMELQDHVDLLTENMKDPDTANAMARTQADARKFVRDAKRQSTRLIEQARNSKELSEIHLALDKLDYTQRQFDGVDTRKSQNLSDADKKTEEELMTLTSDPNANPAMVQEKKEDRAFAKNNLSYYLTITRDGIMDALQSAKRSIEETLSQAQIKASKASTSPASQPTTEKVEQQTTNKKTSGGIIGKIQQKYTQNKLERKEKQASKNNASPTNPFNTTSGRATLQTSDTEKKWREMPNEPPKQVRFRFPTAKNLNVAPELKQAIDKDKRQKEARFGQQDNKVMKK